MKRIYAFEPWFFLFFGVFHLHRIWGLIDRESYADFWLDTMENKGFVYFALMIILTSLCVLGIIVFFKNKENIGTTKGCRKWCATRQEDSE